MDTIMTPRPDTAEWNAYFPSLYSLSVYTSPKTDFDGGVYAKTYKGEKRVLVLLTDERYLEMTNGALFSTGNHPVETLLPMMHLAKAGFQLDVATLSGQRAKFEQWAMPLADKAVMEYYASVRTKLNAPQKLSAIIKDNDLSAYAAIFIPGGHGVLAGIPQSQEAGHLLRLANAQKLFIISLCHGPASLLAAEQNGDFPFKGYALCVFPDNLDEGANLAIGYMPGHLKLLAGKELQARGVTICNEGITGQVHRDRNLLTGDSPLASNALGRLAAETLLDELCD